MSHYKVTETNTNGVSAYYTNDQWGRLLLRLDQDKNIVQKRTYVSSSQVTTGLTTPTLSGPSPVQVSATIPTTFTAATTACVSGTTYTWNFGDGSSMVTALNGNIQTHTYSTNGSYTITVTATNPMFTTVSSSTPVTVQPPPLSVTICQSGAPGWNSCTGIPFTSVTCGTNPHDNLNSYYTVTATGNLWVWPLIN